MKKLIFLLLAAILCLQFAACDILTGSEDQMKNEPQKISHLFSAADGSTLELALTQGQGGSFSPVADQWSRQLDLTDQSVYGDALSRLQNANLIIENGKLNPNGWLKPSLTFINSTQSGSLTMESVGTVADVTGTYTDGAYQVNDSYGMRAVGIATEKGMDVYACIVDLAFRSADGGALSLCTGTDGSTLQMVLNTVSNEKNSTNVLVSFGSSNLRLVFFDTETLDILGAAGTRTTLSSIVTSPKDSSTGDSSSPVFSMTGSTSTMLVALDKDGNEIEGNLNLGELLPGETRRVSVLLYNERNIGTITGNNKEENNKDDKEYQDKYEDKYAEETQEPGTGESSENEYTDRYTSEYTDKYVYEVVTGSVKLEFETGVNVHYFTTNIQSAGYSFNLIFTDK